MKSGVPSCAPILQELKLRLTGLATWREPLRRGSAQPGRYYTSKARSRHRRSGWTSLCHLNLKKLQTYQLSPKDFYRPFLFLLALLLFPLWLLGLCSCTVIAPLGESLCIKRPSLAGHWLTEIEELIVIS